MPGQPCRVLMIHGLETGTIRKFMDKYEDRNLKLVCYLQSEDPIAPVLSYRELSISTSDIVIILLAKLEYDPVTRATLIAAMDFRESQGHKILLIQVGDEEWRAPPEAAFIRLNDLPTEKIDSIEDIASENFINRIKDYCTGQQNMSLPNMTRPQYGRGLAWNYMFGFVFNIMEKEGCKGTQPPLMITKLNEYLSVHPDIKPMTSLNIYLVIPFSHKLPILINGEKNEHLVTDKAVSIKTRYAGLDRDYHLSLYKFGPRDKEVYALVSAITQFNPFFKMVDEGTKKDFQEGDLGGCRTRFLAELQRILLSNHCKAFRNHVKVIIHQSKEEEELVCDSLYDLISSDVKDQSATTE